MYSGLEDALIPALLNFVESVLNIWTNLVSVHRFAIMDFVFIDWCKYAIYLCMLIIFLV